jgi:hypothetical protein
MNDCATFVIACRPSAGGSSLTRSDPFGEKKEATVVGLWLHHAAV